MKREGWAWILLFLIAAGSFLSIRQMDKLCSEILSYSERAYELCQSQQYDRASQTLSTALTAWLEGDDYTHIFIRHSEIDSTADALFEAISAIGTKDAEEIRSALEKLRYHIISIDRMEHISLGSIF